MFCMLKCYPISISIMLVTGGWPWLVTALCYFRQVQTQDACQNNSIVGKEDVMNDLWFTENAKEPFRVVRSWLRIKLHFERILEHQDQFSGPKNTSTAPLEWVHFKGASNFWVNPSKHWDLLNLFFCAAPCKNVKHGRCIPEVWATTASQHGWFREVDLLPM